jgi:hypothetical protein
MNTVKGWHNYKHSRSFFSHGSAFWIRPLTDWASNVGPFAGVESNCI